MKRDENTHDSPRPGVCSDSLIDRLGIKEKNKNSMSESDGIQLIEIE